MLPASGGGYDWVAQIGGEALAHEIDEVVGVEAPLHGRWRGGEALLEALQRVTATFDMWIVGGEEADLLAAVGDDPAGVLMGIGGDANLAMDKIAGLHRHRLQALLVLVEGGEGRIHGPHPPREPGRALLDDADPEAREAVEHAVDDERAQRLHHRSAGRHVADGGEIEVAAVKI